MAKAMQLRQRRAFLVGAFAASAFARSSQAQPFVLRRVAVLAPSSAAREEVVLKPFFKQMGELGWVEGQNVVYDRVFADDEQQRLQQLAVALVARNPEIIYAPPTPAAVAARRATSTIPIVFGAVWDPVGSGLVSSLARPGGNVTGICVFAESLGPKRLQLLREILPGVKRLGWLGDSTDPTTSFERRALEPFAAAFGIAIVEAEAANPAALDAAIERLLAAGSEVIYSGTSPLIYNLRGRLIELANRRRIPVIAYRSQLADAGALFSYGASLPDQIRRSAIYVDRILKGARPEDLPVEQATLFELVVNARAAKVLNIEIPRSILLRADRVVE